VTDVFEGSIIAFKNQDIPAAQKLMKTYKKKISNSCDEITHSIVSGKVADLTTDQSASLALYARFLKRIGAHSRNLISSVVNPFERLGYSEKE